MSLRRWTLCACAKATREAIHDGTDGAVRAASSFGEGFSRFVQAAIGGRGPASLIGPLPDLAEAATCVVRSARECDMPRAHLYRLHEFVDVAFERERKRAFFERALSLDLTAILCGEEPEHSYNGAMLALVVVRRRLVGRPTLVASIGDVAVLYGERAEACFRGAVRAPSFQIKPRVDHAA